MATYKGYKDSACGPQLVVKDDDILSPIPSQKLYNHSPDGFQWGYAGSGPAQLALALLYDVTSNPEKSISRHQDFKQEYVALWLDRWEITTEEILEWLERGHREYA